MSGALPDYYFRLREGGAQVFRLTDDARNRRLEMEPLATISLPRGEVKPQGDRSLSDADRAAIDAWIAERQVLDAARTLDDVHRLADQIGRTAYWAQARADDAALDAVTDALLLAMNDLRGALLRRKAARLDRDG